MKKNIIICILSVIILILSFLNFNDFDNNSNVKEDITEKLFYGNWRVLDYMPVETVTPSAYSGFDADDNFRGQDLIDNIVGQEIFFGVGYIENQGKRYELSDDYIIQIIPIISDDMIIGSASAKTLDITGEYFSMVFFTILSENKSVEGIRDFRTLNQLYIKDINTIYASVNGFLTFELSRIEKK